MLETVRAFDWLINQGKAFYWGTSEWSARQLEEAFRKSAFTALDIQKLTCATLQLSLSNII
jgi:aryl-alcohol dehydrogenase-like predicted oxidoreductase